MKTKFINSVCFARRGYSSPLRTNNYLYSFMEQIKLNNKYGVPGTYLLQYDTLIDPIYRDILAKNCKVGDEIGFWFEVVKDLGEDAGVKRDGREGLTWDHYVKPGFLMSYNKADKFKIIDTAMAKFYEFYGKYPSTVGSWLIDSESMEYMSEKYKTDAFIICREQWGMDGYTLFGAPYYGAYYPSKNNMMSPAINKENQINTPVFKMYVNDPIYCYYEYAKEKYNGINWGLFTQEPGWIYGQTKSWNEWQFDNLFDGEKTGFQYLQLGQENGFDWLDRVEPAIIMQHELLKERKERYGFEYATVGEMGRIFKKQYSETPEKAVGALTDWNNNNNKSVWYNNKNYRINVFSDKERVWIRDYRLFDDNYRDVYLDNPCQTASATYDTLPLMDGIRFNGGDKRAGIYMGNGEILSHGKNGEFYEIKVVANGKELLIKLLDKKVLIESDSDFTIDFTTYENNTATITPNVNEIVYNFNGYTYSLIIEKGAFQNGKINSENSQIVIFGKM